MALYGPYSNVATATTLTTIASLSNKILWLDADTTFATAAHNDPVSSWTDLSGNAYHQVQITAGLKPLVQVSSNTSPNGKVLVRFDGIDDALASAATPVNWPTAAAGYTVYWYGRLKSSASFANLWASYNTGRPQVGYEKALNDVPYIRTEADGTAVKNLHSSNIFDTKMQFLCVAFNPAGTAQGYRAISSGAVTALNQTPTHSLTGSMAGITGITTGYNQASGGWCTMDLAAMLWVNTLHDLTTIQAVRTEWLGTYGED